METGWVKKSIAIKAKPARLPLVRKDLDGYREDSAAGGSTCSIGVARGHVAFPGPPKDPA